MTELADLWWEHWRLSSGTRAERKALEQGEPADVAAACEAVHEAMSAGGPNAVALLIELAEAAPDSPAMVGVGPIEDILFEHGDSIVPDLIAGLRRSPVLVEAFAATWLSESSVSAESFAELKTFHRGTSIE